mgnify:FL=1|jgi:hypothetical protein
MMDLSKNQKNLIVLIGGIGALLTGVIAVVSYVNMKDHRQMIKANAKLDNDLKKLELDFKRSEMRKPKNGL